VVQVNGKVRGRVAVPADVDKAAVQTAVLASEAVRRYTEGQTVLRVIVVPGKLANVVARQDAAQAVKGDIRR